MKNLFFISILSIISLLAACGGTAENTAGTTNSASNNNANGTNITETNKTKDPLAAATATPEATTNNAPTFAPVYKAYCAAWEKKDEAALRKIYSSDTIKDFEKNMKEDGVKTLSEYLADDKASTKFCEARNEKISGDTGTAEVRTEGYSGLTVVFVKENGEWKLTNRRPEGALK